MTSYIFFCFRTCRARCWTAFCMFQCTREDARSQPRRSIRAVQARRVVPGNGRGADWKNATNLAWAGLHLCHLVLVSLQLGVKLLHLDFNRSGSSVRLAGSKRIDKDEALLDVKSCGSIARDAQRQSHLAGSALVWRWRLQRCGSFRRGTIV